MKNIYLKVLLFCLLLSNSLIFSQSKEKKVLRIKYLYTYLKDSTNDNSSRNDIMCLDILEDKSVFYSELRYKGDSLLSVDEIKGDISAMLINRDKYDQKKIGYKIFIDRKNNQIDYYGKLLTDTYTYQEKLEPQKWEITNEIETFHGYTIIKAISKYRGRNYIAWFTKDIAFPLGPYKFNGLPGVILKLSDDKNNFVFDCTFIKNSESNRFLDKQITEKKIIKTYREKFQKIEESYIKDFMNFAKLGSEVQIVSVGNSKKTEEKPYNPIEKY